MRIALTLLFVLSACSGTSSPHAAANEDKPPPLLVEKLEARLAREPCVGSLTHWSPHYRYNRRANHIAKRLIWIDFVIAGYREEAAGVSIDPPLPAGVIGIDDRPNKPEAAYGEYDGRRNSIRWWCDANDPSPQLKSTILAL